MHYLDHAATTPVLPEAAETVARLSAEVFGNPSSVHAYGRAARAEVEDARDRVAAAIGASPAEVVFTSGGTEADNLALKGAALKRAADGRHLVVSAYEHHAVLDSAEALVKQGFELTVVPVTPAGLVEPADVAAAVRPDTVVVSVMAVNNELGTINDVAAITAAVKQANGRALVHTDAVQALGKIPVDVARWGVDLASFSAHKLGGPKGTGALYVRAHTPLAPLQHGGGQERGLRSGTLNAAGIAAFGVAAELAAKDVGAEAERLGALRARLVEGFLAAVPDARLNGDPGCAVAHIVNLAVPGAEGETLLLLLDQAGIACSSGSACQSGALDPSHVLLALGLEPALAAAALRFSFGRTTTEADIDAVLAALPEAVARARRAA